MDEEPIGQERKTLGRLKKFNLDDTANLVRNKGAKQISKNVMKRGCMYVDDNERQTLKVMGGETQKVELTSETFQDDVFDHYLVVKNPTSDKLFLMKANDFILAPKRMKLTKPTTQTEEDAKKTYVEQRMEFSALFEGVKQQRMAKQAANKSEIFDHGENIERDEISSKSNLANVLKTVAGPGSKRKKKF